MNYNKFYFVFLIVVFTALAVLYFNPQDDYEPCDEAVVLEQIQSNVRIDSLTTKEVQFYLVECEDNTQRIQSNRNFQLGSTIEKRWEQIQP